MSGFADALEAQIEICEDWRGGHFEDVVPRGDWLVRSPLDGRPSVELIRRTARHEVTTGETFWVSPEIGTLVAAVSDTFPDIPLRETDLPVPVGFVSLSTPWMDTPAHRVEAFTWSVLVAGNGKKQLSWTAYRRSGGRWALSHHIDWPIGDAWTTFYPDEKGDAADYASAMQALARKICAFFTFVQQRVVARSTVSVPRPTRRRLEKAELSLSPVVRVLVLRVAEHHGTGAGDHQPVEWSCRWLVRGHWRQQWCPSTETHKAIWVSPYVKGPDDKPLRKPRATVFAVVR